MKLKLTTVPGRGDVGLKDREGSAVGIRVGSLEKVGELVGRQVGLNEGPVGPMVGDLVGGLVVGLAVGLVG